MLVKRDINQFNKIFCITSKI